MPYQISRNGQMYGPYTLEDLQRYVASGNVLATDMAKSEEMADWVPVSQVLGMEAPAAMASVPYQQAAVAAYAGAGGAIYPDPPNLNWVAVLFLGIFTCGIFTMVWDIVQSVWVRKVNPRSNALFFYIGAYVVNLGGTFGRMAMMFASSLHQTYMGLGIGIFLITLTLVELARFDMRRAMEEHFNGPDPVGLQLSAVMTFFFGSLYFQYHFTKINEMKRAARYGGPGY